MAVFSTLHEDLATANRHIAEGQAQIAQQKAAQTTRTQRILIAIATALAIAACVLAVLWWDIPVLPDN